MEIEVTAKKVEDAINQGLIQLGATLDEVNVEVLNAGGLFHKARVKLTLEREQNKPRAKQPAEQEAEQAAKPAEKKPEQSAQATAVGSAPEKKPEQKPDKPSAPRAATPREKKTEPSSKNARAPLAAPQQKEQCEQNQASSAQSDCAAQTPPQKQRPKSEKRQAAHRPEKSDVSDRGQDPAASRDQTPRREENSAAQQKAHEFVRQIVARMGFTDVTYQTSDDGETIEISAPSGDDSLIIGRHGETLSALAYLAETSVRAEKSRVSITVDCNGYRSRRAASLTAMARRRADECVAKRRKIKLEPMERIDRRTIHNALNDDSRVSTASEGKEPYRYIVIIPQKRGE